MKKYIIAVALSLFVSNVNADPPQSRTYRLYFLEATGYNTYVKVDGTPKYFYFDHVHSTQSALEAWMNLKWNVLYPNAKGRVRVTGFLNEKDHLFVLQKWAIESPFTVWYQENPDELSADYIIRTETKLTCEHFDNKCPDNLGDLVFDVSASSPDGM